MITLALLGAIIVAAHLVETVTGFGATVIALALGVHLVPLDSLLVTLVVLGWLQSAYLIASGHRQIAWRVLLVRILPLAGVGLAVGTVVFQRLATPSLKLVLGGFVIAVAALDLWRLRQRDAPLRPLGWPLSSALLIGGGIFHGLFASGGPLIVYDASRRLPDKQVFRVTLSTLWLLLNSVLLGSFALAGRLQGAPLRQAAWLVPALVGGIVAGELLHRRIQPTAFRAAVQGLLLITGLSLLL